MKAFRLKASDFTPAQRKQFGLSSPSHPKKYGTKQDRPLFFRCGGIVRVIVTAESVA